MIKVIVEVERYLRPPAVLKKWTGTAEIHEVIQYAYGSPYARARQTKRRFLLRSKVRKLGEKPCEGNITIRLRHGNATATGKIYVRYANARAEIETFVRSIEPYAKRIAKKYRRSRYTIQCSIKGLEVSFH